MRLVAVLTVIAVLASFASASVVEDATGEHYQHDGGIEGDASDDCGEPRLLPDAAVEGMLVPVDDRVDHWGLLLHAGAVVTASLHDVALMHWVASAGLRTNLTNFAPGTPERAPCSVQVEAMPEGASVVFVAEEDGVYVLRARLAGITAHPDLPGPQAQACHPFCTATATYRLSAS